MLFDDKENSEDTNILRLELKTWEKEFGILNGGRKPGRGDIKKDPVIGAKYKQYQKLQQAASIPSCGTRTPQKSKTKEFLSARSISARTADPLTETPRKQKRTESLELSAEEVESTPAHIRRALGPTPQKDGQVLGIFDIALSATPSRPKASAATSPEALVLGTPSKTISGSPGLCMSKTPQSASKHFLYTTFVGTPLKRKRDDEDDATLGTPSVFGKRFATPSFLRRRRPLSSIEENDSGSRATNAPSRKQGLVRSLSSIIQGLKKQEEERMDEELDVLNELEDEMLGIRRSKPVPEVHVEDSQSNEMPLGPDQAAMSDDGTSDVAGADTARKPWKKKGLKRQTRRVIMRPVLHKPQKEAKLTRIPEEDPALVDETQITNSNAPRQDSTDDGASDLSSDDDRPASGGKKRSKRERSKTHNAESRESQGDQSPHAKTSKPRKVNALAHANFRKLKIKNKNSKANGRGRKFGGRR